ncbi:PucR family transcriptional regulator ligand-binding domain-containing protein [Leucobacter insecticola]|uniref:PucR family transcriptional regulator ligand-binding domain-containing protein n=1 Tax=Leucobacter insecticola TaxID=2714934 RepID=UPI001FCADC3C|nr:PucR family transcriptional regulator ligand-binding domain-containing protein [Leucobacter insecticola]
MHNTMLTVAAVLTLPEVAAGDPELIAGAAHTARPVRWAHVVAGADAAAFLDGDELLLTTGAGWPSDDDRLAELVDTLTSAGPAAVILELGAHFAAAPERLITGCEARQIPSSPSVSRYGLCRSRSRSTSTFSPLRPRHCRPAPRSTRCSPSWGSTAAPSTM